MDVSSPMRPNLYIKLENKKILFQVNEQSLEKKKLEFDHPPSEFTLCDAFANCMKIDGHKNWHRYEKIRKIERYLWRRITIGYTVVHA